MKSKRTHRLPKPSLGWLINGLIKASALSITISVATAGVIATNAFVTATMDAGGTQANPAVYRFENGFSKNYTAITVGSATSNNAFHVTGASTALATNGLYSASYVGRGDTGSLGGNVLRTTGVGSRLLIRKCYIGYRCNDNALVVENGGLHHSLSELSVGEAAGGSRNSVLVDNALLTNSSTFNVTGTCSNTFTVINGGQVNCSGIYIGKDNSYGNTAWFEGVGVRVIGNLAIHIGNATTSSNNTLTVASGALAQTNPAYSNHDAYCLKAGDAPGNYLRLAGGFAASKVNPTKMSPSRIQVWNGDDRVWEAGVSGVNYTLAKYATEQLAFDATGYSGLGGYYIYVGGDNYTPPPEKTTVFIIK